METKMKKSLLLIILCLFLTKISFAQAGNPAEKKTFVYVIHMVPEHMDPKTWTPEERKAIKEHMDNLKALFADGTILHAGRTTSFDEKMFGIVVFYAETLEKAKEIAAKDPGVKAGMMTTEVFPYWNVVMRDPAK
jgi:uncharacterized protein YciI